MKIVFEITKATVLQQRHGADIVLLHTTLPPTFPPTVDNEPLCLQFNTRKDSGVDYLMKHVGIPESEITIIRG